MELHPHSQHLNICRTQRPVQVLQTFGSLHSKNGRSVRTKPKDLAETSHPQSLHTRGEHSGMRIL